MGKRIEAAKKLPGQIKRVMKARAEVRRTRKALEESHRKFLERQKEINQ